MLTRVNVHLRMQRLCIGECLMTIQFNPEGLQQSRNNATSLTKLKNFFIELFSSWEILWIFPSSSWALCLTSSPCWSWTVIGAAWLPDDPGRWWRNTRLCERRHPILWTSSQTLNKSMKIKIKRSKYQTLLILSEFHQIDVLLVSAYFL